MSRDVPQKGSMDGRNNREKDVGQDRPPHPPHLNVVSDRMCFSVALLSRRVPSRLNIEIGGRGAGGERKRLGVRSQNAFLDYSSRQWTRIYLFFIVFICFC